MKNKNSKQCSWPANIRIWELLLVLGVSVLVSSSRVAAQSPRTEIVEDNLDRVAATADQIIEVLGQDAGLMVEMKRVMAQDAGAAGRIGFRRCGGERTSAAELANAGAGNAIVATVWAFASENQP